LVLLPVALCNFDLNGFRKPRFALYLCYRLEQWHLLDAAAWRIPILGVGQGNEPVDIRAHRLNG
jgi:hypothetical protein